MNIGERQGEVFTVEPLVVPVPEKIEEPIPEKIEEPVPVKKDA